MRILESRVIENQAAPTDTVGTGESALVCEKYLCCQTNNHQNESKLGMNEH
jgi:hypothetical protein